MLLQDVVRQVREEVRITVNVIPTGRVPTTAAAASSSD